MSLISLMHGTCSCRIGKIRQEGLKPPAYLTDDEDIALYYAECASDECNCGDYGYVVVEVETNKLRADYHSYEEPLSYFRDKYTRSDSDWYEMVSSGEIPSPKNELDYQTSLDTVNSVVHTSLISPEQIRYDT